MIEEGAAGVYRAEIVRGKGLGERLVRQRAGVAHAEDPGRADHEVEPTQAADDVRRGAAHGRAVPHVERVHGQRLPRARRGCSHLRHRILQVRLAPRHHHDTRAGPSQRYRRRTADAARAARDDARRPLQSVVFIAAFPPLDTAALPIRTRFQVVLVLVERRPEDPLGDADEQGA